MSVANDFEVLRGDAYITHVTGHFLAFEDLAGILTLTGGAVEAVRNRHTVRRTQAAEIVALHGTGKAFTDRGADNINLLAIDEVVGGHFGADLNQIVFG